MMVPDKILRNFAFVVPDFMCQVIRCELLLDKYCTHVPLGTDDPRDIPACPSIQQITV